MSDKEENNLFEHFIFEHFADKAWDNRVTINRLTDYILKNTGDLIQLSEAKFIAKNMLKRADWAISIANGEPWHEILIDGGVDIARDQALRKTFDGAKAMQHAFNWSMNGAYRANSATVKGFTKQAKGVADDIAKDIAELAELDKSQTGKVQKAAKEAYEKTLKAGRKGLANQTDEGLKALHKAAQEAAEKAGIEAAEQMGKKGLFRILGGVARTVGKKVILPAGVAYDSFNNFQTAYEANELLSHPLVSEDDKKILRSRKTSGLIEGGVGVVGLAGGGLAVAGLVSNPVGWGILAGAGVYYLGDMLTEVVTGKGITERITDYAYGTDSNGTIKFDGGDPELVASNVTIQNEEVPNVQIGDVGQSPIKTVSTNEASGKNLASSTIQSLISCGSDDHMLSDGVIGAKTFLCACENGHGEKLASLMGISNFEEARKAAESGNQAYFRAFRAKPEYQQNLQSGYQLMAAEILDDTNYNDIASTLRNSGRVDVAENLSSIMQQKQELAEAKFEIPEFYDIPKIERGSTAVDIKLPIGIS